jgi:hypothetical protein
VQKNKKIRICVNYSQWLMADSIFAPSKQEHNMTNTQFFRSLGIVILTTGAVLGLLHYLIAPMQSHWKISLIGIGLFTAVCTALYLAGRQALRSTNKVAFNGLISGSVFGKMVLTLVTLFVYQKAVRPDNQWFVGIFLLIYIVFTAYEVWFMSKLAKQGAL